MTSSGTVRLTDDDVIAARRLQDIRDQIKILNAEADAIKADLLELFEEAEEGVTAAGKTVVTVTRTEKSSISRKKLEALYPTVYEECLEDGGETATIRVKDIDAKILVSKLGLLDD